MSKITERFHSKDDGRSELIDSAQNKEPFQKVLARSLLGFATVGAIGGGATLAYHLSMSSASGHNAMAAERAAGYDRCLVLVNSGVVGHVVRLGSLTEQQRKDCGLQATFNGLNSQVGDEKSSAGVIAANTVISMPSSAYLIRAATDARADALHTSRTDAVWWGIAGALVSVVVVGAVGGPLMDKVTQRTPGQ